MAETWTLEFRCARVGRAALAPVADDVDLLRAARALKSLHGHLTLAVRAQERKGCRSRGDLQRATTSLVQMERELREILLGYGGFRRRELQERVRRAYGCCQDIVALLEPPVAVSQPLAVSA